MSVQLNLFIWSCTCVENGNNQTKVFIKYILQYSIALGQFSSVISKRYTELKNNEMSENLLGIRPLSVPFLICTSGKVNLTAKQARLPKTAMFSCDLFVIHCFSELHHGEPSSCPWLCRSHPHLHTAADCHD